MFLPFRGNQKSREVRIPQAKTKPGAEWVAGGVWKPDWVLALRGRRRTRGGLGRRDGGIASGGGGGLGWPGKDFNGLLGQMRGRLRCGMGCLRVGGKTFSMSRVGARAAWDGCWVC